MLSFTQMLNESIVDDVSDFVPAVIAPGRFNPPHRGHKFMIDELVKLGRKLNAVPFVLIIDSGKYGEKNPLTGEVREEFLKKKYPTVQFIVAKNPYDAVEYLAVHGDTKYVPVGGVTGSDRAQSYKMMVTRMFGQEVGDKYEAVILARDPDAEGDVSGISATKVRQAAAEGNIERLRAMTGFEGDDADRLMKLVRSGMGVA